MLDRKQSGRSHLPRRCKCGAQGDEGHRQHERAGGRFQARHKQRDHGNDGGKRLHMCKVAERNVGDGVGAAHITHNRKVRRRLVAGDEGTPTHTQVREFALRIWTKLTVKWRYTRFPKCSCKGGAVGESAGQSGQPTAAASGAGQAVPAHWRGMQAANCSCFRARASLAGTGGKPRDIWFHKAAATQTRSAAAQDAGDVRAAVGGIPDPHQPCCTSCMGVLHSKQTD